MASRIRHQVEFIDSHTEGEPTRVILSGGPELGDGMLAARLVRFKESHDGFRAAIMQEPRGLEIAVGALLCPLENPENDAGVIYFNNHGYLRMCVHGTIGLAVSLAYCGRLSAGVHRFETPVGVVTATLHPDGRVTVRNVPARRVARQVSIAVPGYGSLRGDVAWGGNWFFLADDHGLKLEMSRLQQLIDFTSRVRKALWSAGVKGSAGEEIDHIILYGPSPSEADSRNFVLCPGGMYDRSPCGTGTSAKVACLLEDGRLKAGEIWRQEGILGGVFEASAERANGEIIPSITGRAFVTSEGRLLFEDGDPLSASLKLGL